MAKTINQIQSLIDSQSLDARQLINLIADYLQANPGGGGGGWLYTGTVATLTGDGILDQDNNTFTFKVPGGAVNQGVQWSSGGQLYGRLSSVNILGNIYGTLSLGNENDTNMGTVQASTLTATHTYELPNADGTIAVLSVANDFADDTAAAVGGILVGGLYHTAGVVKVRLT